MTFVESVKRRIEKLKAPSLKNRLEELETRFDSLCFNLSLKELADKAAEELTELTGIKYKYNISRGVLQDSSGAMYKLGEAFNQIKAIKKTISILAKKEGK